MLNDLSPDISSVIINLFSSFVFSVITYIYYAFMPRYKLSFFFRKMKDDIIIIPSQHESSVADPYKYNTGFIPTGDAIALAKTLQITSSLKNKEKTEVKFINTDEEIKNIQDKNIILIGGPMYNKTTRFILQHFDTKLPFQFLRVIDNNYEEIDIKYKTIINRKQNNSNYKNDINLNKDYGMFISLKNPWATGKWIFIAAGLSPASTNGTINYIHKMSLFHKLMLHKKEFSIIINTTNQSTYPNAIMIRKEII